MVEKVCGAGMLLISVCWVLLWSPGNSNGIDNYVVFLTFGA